MQVDSKSNLLIIRLWREVMVRNRLSGWVHLHFVLISAFIASRMHDANLLSLSSYGFILMGCMYRVVIFKKIDRLGFAPKNLEILHNLALFAIGVGWGLYWYDVQIFYGRFSIYSMFAFLTLSAFISGAVPSNSPRPWGYICLALPMSIIPMTQFMLLDGVDHKVIAYCVMVYLGFNIYQLKVSYDYIRGYIEKDLAVTNERDKMRTLFDAVPGYVCIIDNDLNYISMNENAQGYFKMKDFYKKHISIPNEDSQFVRFVTKFMHEEKITAVTEMRYEMNPGHSHAIMQIQKLKGPTGGAIIVAIPIDELVESREIIKAQEAKAFYTAKLISLGEMAAGIAHEINNPLAIILGSSDHIQRELKKPNMQLERVEILNDKIQRTVERISLIIKSLRILSRNGEKDPHISFKLETIIEPSLEISRQRFREEKIELEVLSPEKDLICIGQEIQLSQVMMNLLSNAFDAALEGPSPRWVKLEVKPHQEHVEISIQDSGPGIPFEIRNKIMDPFFTTKAINKGTGLGLSISKSIMEQHGGMLTLDERQKHTTFVMKVRRAYA